jgi:hypothetical protein
MLFYKAAAALSTLPPLVDLCAVLAILAFLASLYVVTKKDQEAFVAEIKWVVAARKDPLSWKTLQLENKLDRCREDSEQTASVHHFFVYVVLFPLFFPGFGLTAPIQIILLLTTIAGAWFRWYHFHAFKKQSLSLREALAFP